MPLNYSKWDALELSDDSDIEGHPNVDKRSLIRWKQRDIHEKREERKHRIALLEADIACNAVLQPRLRTIADEVASKGPAHFSALVERFKTEPSPERPPTNAPEQQTYDEMLLNLMLTIWEEVKKAGIDKDDARLGELLVQGLEKHFVQMGEHQGKQKQELAQLQEDNKRKITSDDIHVGFDSHYVPPKPEPSPIKGAIEPSKPKKTTEYEVLNPKGVEGTTTTSVPAASSSSSVASDDELPELTPSLEQFSHLPLRGYQQSWDFIRSHRDVYVAGASDALLVAAFKAQNDGKAVYAQQCVHQSLLIQYCEKLGPDGVTLFFRKMVVADPRASSVFENDVAQTYAHLAERVRISKAEEAAVAGEEQIQLVAENPSQSISFNIPDGPPPEHLQLEGPGFEDVNIEDVRKALQMRWDVFQGFSEAMQEALKSQELDKVNKVLGSMSVKEAEDVVQLLDLGGILNFSSGGIRDETGEEGEGVEEQEVEQ